MKPIHQGVTLIEVIIALAMVAIIAAMAFPAYTSSITRARRADGQIALLDLAAHLDRYYTQQNTYQGATLSHLGMPATSSKGFYHLRITALNTGHYRIEAAPLGVQASNDKECAMLTYDDLGSKGITGHGNPENCW